MEENQEIKEPLYTTIEVANTLLDLAYKKKIKVKILDLIKLIYFSHGWHLAIKDRPLINERFRAEKEGFTLTSIYNSYVWSFARDYSNSLSTKESITKKYRFFPTQFEGLYDLDLAKFKWYQFGDYDEYPTIPDTDNSIIELLNKILDVYGKFTSGQLCSLAYEKNSPQEITYKLNKPYLHTEIPEQLIKEYFISKSEENDKETEYKEDYSI